MKRSCESSQRLVVEFGKLKNAVEFGEICRGKLCSPESTATVSSCSIVLYFILFCCTCAAAINVREIVERSLGLLLGLNGGGASALALLIVLI